MIEVNHLCKRYGNHTAVWDLSFRIEKGQIYGFLGPNGAGKSTTMNIMTGCLAATSGDVRIGGFDIFEEGEQAKKLIGYLPEQPPLYLDRTPREYLTFVARAKGIPEKQIPEQLNHVMTVTQTLDVADRLIKNLSKGYKQRVGIAQAILGDPEVIILDEPTVGLDPRQIMEIRDLIKELGKTHTVILSSHILSEVQAVCQTILIISKGRLVACDTPENLERMLGQNHIVEIETKTSPAEIRRILKNVPGIEMIETQPAANGITKGSIREKKGEDIRESVFRAFASAGIPLLTLKVSGTSLEDVFMELTQKDTLPSAFTKNTRWKEFIPEEKAEKTDTEDAVEKGEEGDKDAGDL